MFFANHNINRLAVHAALVSLAWGLAGIFFTVYLRAQGCRQPRSFSPLPQSLPCVLHFARWS
jgi:hypothetical protein